MSNADNTSTVEIEREYPHPPAVIWRALTEPDLLERWLMSNDFALADGHQFRFTADWGAVECQVLESTPYESLSYTWAAHGLESVVAWTLTPTESGTLVRMTQTGFKEDQKQAYQGAKHGWPRFLDNLAALLSCASSDLI